MPLSADVHSSVSGETFYVSVGQFAGSDGNYSGCSLEFRKCAREKAWRTVKTTVLLCLVHAVTCTVLSAGVDSYMYVHVVMTSATCLYLLLSLFFSAYKESVVMVTGLGVQISSTNWCGYTRTTFVPHTIISDVVINEGITMCKVIFYLAVVVVRDKTEPHCKVERLLPLFVEFSPRLACLESACHLLQDVLLES